MTEQEKKEYETRKKIASTLLHANEIMEGHGFVFCLKIADALIAAEIGDVSKWKDKATAAELVAQAAANTAIERIEDYKHRAEVAERALRIAKYWGELCAPVEDYIKQAEKELAEERK